GPIEGGGRASGYFTGATGGTIYRGDAFPNGFLDNYFVGDAGGNLVHRKILTPDGVSLKAARPAGEQKIEFIASRDTWFRPVQFANAPDGTLYVIDMYREVIEHPWSLPDNLKKLLDLYSGSDRGRIYRITPDGFKRPPMPRLGSASAAELVAALESRNGWERDTASRLLYERQDKAAVPRLRRLLASSTFPLARLHALHALDGLGALNESVLLEALHDSAAPVREHAIKLSEKFMPDGRPSRRILKQLQSLASDPDARVRYQLAFTLGEIRGDSKIKPLAAIARRDLDSSWTQAAILSSLAEGAGGVFQTLSSDPAVVKDPQGEEFLSRLAGLVGAQNRKSDVARVLAFLKSVQQPRAAFALALALSDGLHRAGSSLSTASDLSRLIAAAKKSAADSAVDAATRDSAIRLLGITTFADSGSMLLDLLNAKQPEPVQLASLAALSRFTDPELGPALAKSWPALGSRLRDETVAVLLARADRALALLNAIKAGQIRPAALTTAQAKMIRNYHDKSVRDLALKVLGPQHTASRQQVIEAYLPALQIKGDPGRGRKIYEARCISCHRVAGEGSAVGPDLVTVKNMGAEKILINVLDPNREVRPDYLAYFVETKDQESVVGLLANETPTTITLRQPYGKEQVINRSDIQQMKSQGQSLMPEGLEAGLKPQDLADLISFVEAATDKPLASSGK
ncbi:MAG TPA: HEAT repeat domain-containing protein, partial [Verrucomicrobiae bacterium]|nr:HEAT repeat domain-containing protein [Verrucomicrobiae bacterium]